MKSYAGIGSRDCPKEVFNQIVKTAYWLAMKGYTLRSGGADGCDKAKGQKEVYLPWAGFNSSKSAKVVHKKEAFEIAEKYHPRFNTLKDSVKKLQARNSHQVLGEDLGTPCDFVICYTKDGLGNGGTGQALRIAKDYNIPIFDFGKYPELGLCREEFKKFAQEHVNSTLS